MHSMEEYQSMKLLIVCCSIQTVTIIAKDSVKLHVLCMIKVSISLYGDVMNA